MAERVFTIGYGGRHPDEFLQLLISHQSPELSMSGAVRIKPTWAFMSGPSNLIAVSRVCSAVPASANAV